MNKQTNKQQKLVLRLGLGPAVSNERGREALNSLATGFQNKMLKKQINMIQIYRK